ncbi:MAG: type II toxin-antitoxin system VapC family toxin [Promethearchaeota archaeon]
MKIGLDTNIFLNVKNKEKEFYEYSNQILNAVDNHELEAVISIITIAELSVGYYKSNELGEKDEFISGLYSNQQYNIINLDLKVADKSAEIRNKTRLKLPDAMITASAVLEQCTCLITNDGRFNNAKKYLSIYSSKEFCENFLGEKEK